MSSRQIQTQGVKCPQCGKPVKWNLRLKPQIKSLPDGRVVITNSDPCCGVAAAVEVRFTEGQIQCSTTFQQTIPVLKTGPLP